MYFQKKHSALSQKLLSSVKFKTEIDLSSSDINCRNNKTNASLWLVEMKIIWLNTGLSLYYGNLSRLQPLTFADKDYGKWRTQRPGDAQVRWNQESFTQQTIWLKSLFLYHCIITIICNSPTSINNDVMNLPQLCSTPLEIISKHTWKIYLQNEWMTLKSCCCVYDWWLVTDDWFNILM